MTETWKDIQEYEGLYQISNLGRVKRLESLIPYVNKNQYKNVNTILHKKDMILKNILYENGYYGVSLYKKNVCKIKLIHRLIAIHFIPNKFNKKQVNHIDGIKTNNDISNLEWATPKENVKHAWETGLSKPHQCTNEKKMKIQKSLKKYYKPIKKEDKPLDKRYGHHCKKKISLMKDNKIYNFNSKKEMCEYLGINQKTFWRYEKRKDEYIYEYKIIYNNC